MNFARRNAQPAKLASAFTLASPVIMAVLMLVGLYAISQVNYLLFHSLAELFSVVIAFTIFVLTWNSRVYLNNGYLVVLGLSFLFTGGLDLAHTLAFNGMGVFEGTADPIYGPNLATQLWLAARFMQAGSAAVAPFFYRRSARAEWVVLAYGAISALILASIFAWGNFPAAFIGGMTPFKRYSEYVIIGLILAGTVLLERTRPVQDPSTYRLLLASLAVTALSELAFTGYLAVNDVINLLGHFLKIIAFVLIYKAIIETGFLQPQDLLFRELKESESRERARAVQLAAMMDAVPAIVRLAMDPRGEMVIGNRASMEIFGSAGFDPEAEPARPPRRAFQVYDWHDHPFRPEDFPLQRAIRTRQPVRNLEEMLRFEDGEEMYLYGNATPLFDETGQVSGAVAVLIDVTSRVHAEQALKTSEARLRRLVDANIIGIMYTGFDGRVGQGNDAFLDIVGYTREDLEAGRVSWRTMTPPEYAPLDEMHIAEAIERGACSPYEKAYIRKDGVRVPVLLGFAYLKDTELPFVCFVLDLSEQKSAEAAVARYAAQLEMSNLNMERANTDLELANRELERANLELARANRELQDFAFVASHDLQEPLRKIQAFGERLSSQSAQALDEESRDYLSRMLNAAGRMRAMITDLLVLSRVTTRGNPFETVDLNEVASEVLSDLELRIERTGAEVIIDDLPEIQADRTQMHQLLQNLIANALKFQPDGGHPRIRVYNEFTPDGRNIILTIEDNGIGFEEQYSERIFQPFQRLHGMGRFEGSGMGLAICRKIVERHAGAIEARSTPGQGARFMVTLPVRVPWQAKKVVEE